MKTAILNRLGGLPDDLLNSVPLVGLSPNRLDRDAYLERLRFYADLGPQFDREKTLRIPNEAPSHSVVDSRPFHSGQRLRIEYPSRYTALQPALAEEVAQQEANRTGTLYVWRKETREPRPMVLCAHGFMMDHPARARRMFRIEKLFSLGMDVGLYIAPHHGRRLAPGLPKHHLLNPADLPMTVEGLLQNLHDLHSAVLLLQRMGWEKMGLIGASLGGFTAALYAAAVQAPLEFIFMAVPALGFDGHLHPRRSRLGFAVDEETIAKGREAMRLVSPLSYAPQFPPQRIWAVVHTGDRVCDNRLTRRWVREWKIDHLTEVIGGHWLYLDRQARGKAWYGLLERMEFLAEKR